MPASAKGLRMSERAIRDFHAHIYFDADQLDRAQSLAAAAHDRFGVPVGRFHVHPVGPHPRGSCQLTVRSEQFGDFAQWIALNRDGLTIFAHTSTGDDLPDHTDHVIWFGPSETLDLSVLD
jgi:aromatic ring-cleaving dioxygenase